MCMLLGHKSITKADWTGTSPEPNLADHLLFSGACFSHCELRINTHLPASNLIPKPIEPGHLLHLKDWPGDNQYKH